ncbi:hypothetical protein GCM10027294_18130 [Marinactinospora endophytica]
MRLVIRRAVTAVATAAAAVLLTLPTATGAHAALTPEQVRGVTDTYLFATPLAEFDAIRDQRPHADQLVWDSDGCSWSPDEPFGYEFLSSCERHDFGYRNYKQQSRFTEEARLRIDNQFRTDMYSVCGGNVLCRGVAVIYYNAVREFGGSGVSTAEALERANAIERAESYLARHAVG